MLDLAKGYWQIPMEAQDREKTAFSRLCQFTIMPFGLCGAPATFQRMMNLILRGLNDFASVYLDNIEKLKRSTTKKDVRAFFGMTGYYRRFIRDFTHIAGAA